MPDCQSQFRFSAASDETAPNPLSMRCFYLEFSYRVRALDEGNRSGLVSLDFRAVCKTEIFQTFVWNPIICAKQLTSETFLVETVPSEAIQVFLSKKYGFTG
jgi:hypothetical protein